MVSPLNGIVNSLRLSKNKGIKQNANPVDAPYDDSSRASEESDFSCGGPLLAATVPVLNGIVAPFCLRLFYINRSKKGKGQRSGYLLKD
jgi:hypothetical protein